MQGDRFEVDFLIDPEINNDFEIQALKQADKMADSAEKEGKKGAIFCQVYLSDSGDKANIIGRFICYEAGLEIAKVFKKYGYPCVDQP